MSVFPSQVNFVTGDILTATAVNEIGQAINLLDGAQFAAGKNKIINGDFGYNQRNFTSVTTTNTFTFDRFSTILADGTVTYTPQVFTPGTAPVVGYEANNYLRCVTSGQTLTTAEARIIQKIENVRTFAGQTVTISFWAKAGSGTPSIALELVQTFGSGGSTSVTGIIATKQTISPGWARYTWTGAVPSISGKTVGTANDSLQVIIWLSAGSSFDSRTGSLGIQNNTFDIWGVQAEAANTASNFQTATGTKQGEVAACERYYKRVYAGANYGRISLLGMAETTTSAQMGFPTTVTMRISPSSVDFPTVSTLRLSDISSGQTVTGITLSAQSNRSNPMVVVTVASGLTAYRPYYLEGNNDANAYIGFNAEL